MTERDLKLMTDPVTLPRPLPAPKAVTLQQAHAPCLAR
jgi:hypothetical protein